MENEELSGLLPDLVVPLDASGAILIRDFIVHVQRMAHVREISGVVVVGSAGEHGGFDEAERVSLLEATASAVPPGFPFLVGIHARTVGDARSEIAAAAAHGASGVVLFDLPPDRVGAATSGAPIPVLAASPADADVAGGLAALDAVTGLVVDSHDAQAFARLGDAVDGAAKLFVGAAGHELIEHLEAGAHGAILTEANVAPDAWGRVVAGTLRGDSTRAADAFRDVVVHVVDALGGDSGRSAVPAIKTALAEIGVFDTAELRTPGDDVDIDELKAGLVRAGLLLG